ncbi:MAG: DUF4981 domain-containing protein [Tannerellaceae bacterium]|jgi:beta-galactosidase|nr:DUF4981 domain-containing protein [Tannerellaceae bacterium]
MRKISFFLSVFFCAGLFAQSVPDWENPEVFAVNKEATRATSLPYPDEKLAATDDYSKSPYFLSLNGKWKFCWVPKVAEVPEGFYNENYPAGGWADMPVPGNWEFNGYGIPMYVNNGFGFRAHPPHIDREDSPTGAYRHEFSIPDDWEGRRVFLHFEAGTNAMYVWVNGQKVGYTQNAKSPAEFDITSYIRKGNNLLACQVHKFSDGSYLEDQDMWRLGGINRSVYLYSTAQTRILDFFAHPDLDKNYKNGLFSLEVKLKNYTLAGQPQIVEVSILDKAGKKVFGKSQNVTIPANGINEIKWAGTIPSPLKWTAETPNLYTLLITLKNANGKLIESTSHKIGFRKITINDGQLLVNGTKVFFKGVNLHEFNTATGNVVTREVMIRNLELMKQLNINAVRTSHYPQPALWYKLCDEYGIYLVDEANLESHGLGYGKDNVSNFPEWKAQHLDRIIRLIERDKNHASVIFWSLGNEASNGKAFFDMYDWAKKRDGSRPVQYEQAYQRDPNTDIICLMYPSWPSMLRDAEKDLGKPYIMCEYAHAMGNSMGNLQDYWNIIRSSKNMQGGFIWEWYNHGYPATDEQGRFYWAYGGDLNGWDKMNDGNFCMDGIISPDQQLIPHSHIVKKVYQNILFEAKDLNNGIITVINDFKFTDISNQNYDFKWVLLKNGQQTAEGTIDVSVKANSRKDVKLNLPPTEAEEGVEYYLQVYASVRQDTPLLKAGYEVAKGEMAFEPNHYFVQHPAGNGSIETEKKDDKLLLKAGAAVYEFSTKDGRTLLNITGNGKRIFRELPRPNFWRAPTDNDFGASDHYNMGLWNPASHNCIYIYKGIKDNDGGITLTYEAKLRGIEAKVDLTYTVNKDGTLTIDAHYRALSDELPEMMRFGMIMTLPQEMNDFTWYGRGPHENYTDRNEDAFMGIWNGKVEDQAFAYYRPQETGNKTGVRWLTLKNREGKGIEVRGNQPLSVSATNYKPEDLDPGMTKKQQHWPDVTPRRETVLCIDLFQRGVAGLNSWGAKPLDPYRFSGKEYRYSFTVRIL